MDQLVVRERDEEVGAGREKEILRSAGRFFVFFFVFCVSRRMRRDGELGFGFFCLFVDGRR